MRGTDLEAMTKAYLQAYDQRDLSECMGFFAEDAIIRFAMGVYKGKQAIEEWHKDRFGADLRMIRVEGTRIQGDKVIVDAIATSKTAKAWGFDSVAGTATFVFQGGKIKQVKFGLRMSIPLEGW